MPWYIIGIVVAFEAYERLRSHLPGGGAPYERLSVIGTVVDGATSPSFMAKPLNRPSGSALATSRIVSDRAALVFGYTR